MLPSDGRIKFVSNFTKIPRAKVCAAWEQAEFLDGYKSAKRSWIAVTMSLVRQLDKRSFTLAELYELEGEARKTFPNNVHVREKLRQQLQQLRDKGWLHFEGRGNYRLSENALGISG